MPFDPDSLTGFRYRQRNAVIMVTAVFALVLLRLFTMQVLQGTKYRGLSEENRMRVEILAAPRGEIRDRNGFLLADNVPSFTVTLDPYDKTYVDHPALLDSTAARLGAILGVDAMALRDKVRKDGRRSFLPVRLKRNVDLETVAYVAEHESELPGVDVESEPLRRYTLGEMASHLLGYVGEVNDKELEDPTRAHYLRGDLIGKMGVERQYERYLRGEPGKRFVEVNALGRKSTLLGDRRPVLARRGAALTLTIDAKLQRAAEEAFAPGARGAAVAIDPRTGEVLALASKPNYDPNEFSTGISFQRWQQLSEKGGTYPLFNRAISAAYPPGSTLKPLVALAALMAGAIHPGTTFRETCDGAFQFGRRSFRCWNPDGHGTLALRGAMAQSCDVYFYQLGVRLGLERLSDAMKRFRASEKSGIDLPQERRGLFPDAAWYDKRYGAGRWSRGLILNLAIGQGETSLTPIKLVQLTALIANGGSLVRPHVIRSIEDQGRPVSGLLDRDSTGTRIEIPPDELASIRASMEAVVADPRGTGYAARVDSVRVAGKTGTAQNPHGNDHALFICFAPVENPRIAVAVMVENAGHGSTAAAPIAQKVLQAYFHPTPAESVRVVASR
jgi:penicillin-binding protein 2